MKKITRSNFDPVKVRAMLYLDTDHRRNQNVPEISRVELIRLLDEACAVIVNEREKLYQVWLSTQEICNQLRG